MRGGVVALVLATAVMSACGGAQRSDPRPEEGVRTETAPVPRSPTPREPRAIGQAGLLVLADLPPGMHRWRPFQSSIACGGEDPFADAIAIVRSPRFHGEIGDVQETIGVFRDTRAAARAHRRLSAPQAVSCFARRLRGEMVRRAREQTAVVHRAQRQILTCLPLGARRSYAERFVFPVEKGPGLSGNVYIDVFENTLGRTVSSIVTVSRHEPFGQEVYESFVARAMERIEAVIGVDSRARS